MSVNIARLALRAIAVLIAIAGLIDPAFTVSRPPSQRLVAIALTSTPALNVEQALRSNLPGWEIDTRAASSRLPCAAGERCVVIADGSKDIELPRDLATPLALVSIASASAPNVSITSVVTGGAHQRAGAVARVELAGAGVEGRSSEIRVIDGTAVVGSAGHKWSNASPAFVDVPWWPIGAGARRLRVEVTPVTGESSTIDNHIDAGVDVQSTRSPVLVFDARPSWSSTFVRRALEDDARYSVGYRARLAPSLSAGTANGRLDAAALDLASAVVIGGPDALGAADIALLDRYVNVRGGTLVLLAERAPSGSWARLLPGEWTEHLTATPEPVGPLRASEILRANRLPATATTVARSGAHSAIVVLPVGHGRIVVSGAMDAWRYRDQDAGGFDRFWRSLIAEGAAAGQATQLTFDRVLAANGSRIRFTIRDRRMTPVAAGEASAVLRCGDGPASAVRLWPDGASNSFTGEVAPRAIGACTIEARIDDRIVSGAIAVADNPSAGVGHTLAKLERSVRAMGGTVERAGDEATLARAIESGAAPPPVDVPVHPMRSAWWLLPFAGCLSAEWWLRRRSGLR